MSECPHTEDIGGLKARMVLMEKKLEELTATAQNNASAILSDKATSKGFKRGLDVAAKIIGYVIIIGTLFAAGKFTGLFDLLIKVLKL